MYSLNTVNYHQISNFFESVINIIEPSVRYVQNSFEKKSNNFSETYSFLSSLGMVYQRNEEILINPKLDYLFSEDIFQQDKLIKHLIKELFNPKQFLYKYIVEYLSYFHFHIDKYMFTPTLDERLQYSGIRNLLMELGIVKAQDGGKSYYIYPAYEQLLTNILIPRGTFTPSELAMLNSRNQELGTLAEKCILQYEHARLSRESEIQSLIEYVAEDSVDAGYDILSYELPLSGNQIIPRLIEVKAVSPKTFKFYFSKKEMDIAKQMGKKYHLYLLPVLHNSDFDISSLKIIKDPINHLFNHQEGWNVEVENLSFQIINWSGN